MTRYWENWTDAAVDCYNRGCVCRGCVVRGIIGSQCKMKQAVMSLVRQFGKPPKKEDSFLPCITPKLQQAVDVILAGATTKAEIANKLGISQPRTQFRINLLCGMVETQGYRFTKRWYRLPELIEFLKDIEGKRNDTRDE